jgi:exodeoxyribonuclease VII small subunit
MLRTAAFLLRYRASMASKAESGKEGFEAIYSRLESTVATLEKGGLTLEESLNLYEEGMQLARQCQEMLQDAELRITRLQESFTNGLNAVREERVEYAEPGSTEPEELPLE